MKLAYTLTLSALFLAAGCDSSGSSEASPATGDSTGVLLLEVTDAPLELKRIASVVVGIDQVLIHREADGESGFIEAYEGAPFDYELSNLRNGVTSDLARLNLEPGSYRQLRLRMPHASMRLDDDRTFTTDDGSLKLTSHDTVGMKFFLEPPIEIVEGEETSVILDFILHNAVTPIPANDVENARAFKFHPNVRVAIRNNAGDIDGIVLQDDGTGSTAPAEGALIHLLEAGETDLEQSIATTITEADGTAAFLAVTPGMYDLVIEFEDQTMREGLLSVVAEGTTSFVVTLPME